MISKINFWAFLVLLAALPYPLPIIRTCWTVWCITWLAELRFLDKRNFTPSRGVIYLSAGIFVWILWNMVSVAWAGDTTLAWHTVGRYCSLLPIPLVGLFGVNKYYKTDTCIKVLLSSALISVGVYMFTHYWVINRWAAIDKHNAEIKVIDWLHMDDLLLDIKHRLHYTNLLCMLLPCLVLARKKTGTLAALAAGALILIAIYLTGSRVALINLVLIAVITAAYYLLRTQKRWVQALGVSLAFLCISGAAVGVTYFHQRSVGMEEPRLLTWQTAIEHPQDYLAHGLGAGNATPYLVNLYEANGLTEHVQYQYSPHNQYLGVCMDLGLVAALLFVLFWLAIPFFFRGETRYWILCLWGISLCAMMTDMLIGGLEGIVFVVVMPLLSFIKKSPEIRPLVTR